VFRNTLVSPRAGLDFNFVSVIYKHAAPNGADRHRKLSGKLPCCSQLVMLDLFL